MISVLFASGASIVATSNKPRPPIQVTNDYSDIYFEIYKDENKVERKRCFRQVTGQYNENVENIVKYFGTTLEQLKKDNPNYNFNSLVEVTGLSFRHYVDCGDKYIDRYSPELKKNYLTLDLSYCFMSGMRIREAKKCEETINKKISIFKPEYTKYDLEKINTPKKWSQDNVFKLLERYNGKYFYYVVDTKDGNRFDPGLYENSNAYTTDTIWFRYD